MKTAIVGRRSAVLGVSLGHNQNPLILNELRGLAPSDPPRSQDKSDAGMVDKSIAHAPMLRILEEAPFLVTHASPGSKG